MNTYKKTGRGVTIRLVMVVLSPPRRTKDLSAVLEKYRGAHHLLPTSQPLEPGIA